MKLEVGMYVRTTSGYISKVQEILDKYSIYCETVIGYDYEFTNMAQNCEISKASHQLIDLIEVGDYVNGYKVLEIYTCISGEKVCKIQTEYKTKDELSLPYEIPCVTEKHIESIVTKEQFSSMEYKVKE